MKPILWLGLLLTAGAALAVSLLPDDEVPTLATAVRHETAPSAVPAARIAATPVPGQGAPATPAADSAVATAAPRAPWPGLDEAARAAWQPPPPPPVPDPVAAATPAPPPAFPYPWLGQLDDGGPLKVFLAGPQRTHVASPGDVIDQRWRIDGVALGRLRVTWLPSGATLQVGRR